MYLETSGATGQNVDRAVEILLDRVMRRITDAVDRSLMPHQKILSFSEESAARKKKGCTC